MTTPNDPQRPLREFAKTRDFFIGIDSDGCVFDTMEVKHKECFIPNIIKFYGLAAISKYVREAAEFVNLYSDSRGVNRFPGIPLTLDLLKDRPEITRRGFELPALEGLRSWLSRTNQHSNPALKAEVEATADPDLKQALAWSEGVNRTIAEIVHDVPPFPFVRESLDAMQGRADVMVVSATPTDALVREWEEHGLKDKVALIAGQELGNKKDQLHLATHGRYQPNHVLMVGDAPGDLKAAFANGALFFPINPGSEDDSWRVFHDEALPRFFAGNYEGAYMDERIAAFQALLPGTPPWKRA